jgi:adenosylmethionine-8-amino-7-oxononanoate aminotransferase
MIWHPMSIEWGENQPRRVVQAEGDYITLESGQRILDGISSWWTCIFGHRPPEIMEAIQTQLTKLDHVLLAGFSHEPAEKFAEGLLRSTGNQFHKVFFSDNGSNAVEIAVKLAVQFFRNRNRSEDRDKKIWVRFSKSYHGDSIGAMSLGGDSVFTRIFRDLSFPSLEFPSPNCKACYLGKKPETCQVECLEDFRKELEIRNQKKAKSANDRKNQREESKSTRYPRKAQDPDSQILGVILEPLVAGANGMIFHSEKFLQRLRQITKENGVILIFDEVFTGLYRTGDWYAFLKANVQPDLLCLAKGLTGGSLPLGVTLVSEEIYREFYSPDPNKAFYHGHTMSGNPIACAAGVASLDLLGKTGSELVSQLEKNLRKVGVDLEGRFPGLVRNLRVMGGILAFEVETDLGPDEYLNPLGRRIRESCMNLGLLIRPLGNTVYLTPSYRIQESDLDFALQVLTAVLEKEFTP